MTGFKEMRRLELWMTYVRWFGVIFGGAAVAIQPSYPNAGVDQTAWALIVLLALGNLAIWGALSRIGGSQDLVRLGVISFAFDIVVVCSLVWVFAYEDPYVTWALLFVLPLEGALRYRMRGAMIATGIIAFFFIPQTLRVADLRGSEIDIATYVFVLGLAILIAGVGGTMAENWHEQRLAYEQQSLRLAEVDALKDRFLAITSHEIRSPLTAIITGVDTIQKRGERLSEDQRERLLEMVSSQGHQLARLVDDLLITTQLQGGKLALQPSWAELQPIVDQALSAAAPKRRSHQLEVFVEPFECEVDKDRVAQTIRNLVENAYKYTPERTRVAVTAGADESGLTITVEDEGPGIPADKREQLFEAFGRIEETSAGQDGVGLGLYVVSQLVAAMRGHIDLASSRRGSRFTLYIPARARALAAPKLGLVEGQGRGSSAG